MFLSLLKIRQPVNNWQLPTYIIITSFLRSFDFSRFNPIYRRSLNSWCWKRQQCCVFSLSQYYTWDQLIANVGVTMGKWLATRAQSLPALHPFVLFPFSAHILNASVRYPPLRSISRTRAHVARWRPKPHLHPPDNACHVYAVTLISLDFIL